MSEEWIFVLTCIGVALLALLYGISAWWCIEYHGPPWSPLGRANRRAALRRNAIITEYVGYGIVYAEACRLADRRIAEEAVETLRALAAAETELSGP